MKKLHRLFVLALLIVAAPSLSFGMMSIENVSKERARELGIHIRAEAAGPRDVWIVCELEPKGVLKEFSRVDLEITDGGKLLVSAPLRVDRSKPGRISVSFVADRAHLDQMMLRIVAGQPMNMHGHDLRMKGFVELPKLK